MILEFLWPTHCAGCGSLGRDVCDRCTAALTTVPSLLRGVHAGTPPLVAAGAYAGVLRAMILALKFRGTRNVGRYIGRALATKIVWPCDAVVPVPLHAQRLRERGYNQAAEIARAIAARARLPLFERALLRVRATQPQSTLDLEQRRENVSGAFCAGPQIDAIRGRRVLLVDDVVTTGATARACAATLDAAGARAIYLAAAALRL